MDDELGAGATVPNAAESYARTQKKAEPDSILDLAKRMRERRRTRPLVTGTDLRNENGGT